MTEQLFLVQVLWLVPRGRFPKTLQSSAVNDLLTTWGRPRGRWFKVNLLGKTVSPWWREGERRRRVIHEGRPRGRWFKVNLLGKTVSPWWGEGERRRRAIHEYDQDDLQYFLAAILGIEYAYLPELAPTGEIMDAYKKHGEDWSHYEERFRGLLESRGPKTYLKREYLDSACRSSRRPRARRRDLPLTQDIPCSGRDNRALGIADVPRKGRAPAAGGTLQLLNSNRTRGIVRMNAPSTPYVWECRSRGTGDRG